MIESLTISFSGATPFLVKPDGIFPHKLSQTKMPDMSGRHETDHLAVFTQDMKTRLKFTSYSKRAKWALTATVALVMINFFTFVAISHHLGGDAMNGYIDASHYFVCAHGHCSEVSSSIWHYSWWHALSAQGGILLVFALVALFLNTGDIQFE